MGAGAQSSHVLAGAGRRRSWPVACWLGWPRWPTSWSPPSSRATPATAPRGSCPSEDLWRSCHDNLTRILQLVGGTEAYHGQEYDAARATGQRRAEQGLPIDDLLRSFRMGGRLVWEALVAEARDQDIDDDGLLDVGTRVWEVVDRTSSQVAAAYHDAERLAVRADEQRRTSIWEGLLSGVGEDPGFAFEAGPDARGPRSTGGTSSWWPSPRPATPTPYAGSATGSPPSASSPRGRPAARRWSACVLARRRTPDRELDALRDGARGPRPAPRRPSTGSRRCRAASGRPRSRCARSVPATPSPRLDERLPEAMLVQSPELAQQLVRTWLGSLLDLPEAERGPLLDDAARLGGDLRVGRPHRRARALPPQHGAEPAAAAVRGHRARPHRRHNARRAGAGAARSTVCSGRPPELCTPHNVSRPGVGSPGIPRPSDALSRW